MPQTKAFEGTGPSPISIFMSAGPAAPARTGQILFSGLSSPVGPGGHFQSDPGFRSWVRSGMEEGRMFPGALCVKRQDKTGLA